MDDPTPTVDAPSKPPQRFRRTRIAVAVFFGAVAVAFCMLWVRSYYARDELIGFGKAGIRTNIATDRGSVLFMRLSNMNVNWDGWVYHSTKPSPVRVKYNWDFTHATKWVVAPLWAFCLAAITASLAAAPRYRPRFTLLTMFIATTLVAVVLGLGVWLAS